MSTPKIDPTHCSPAADLVEDLEYELLIRADGQALLCFFADPNRGDLEPHLALVGNQMHLRFEFKPFRLSGFVEAAAAIENAVLTVSELDSKSRVVRIYGVELP